MVKKTISNFYTPPKNNTKFSEGNKSAGILDDFAVRKDIEVLQGNINDTPVLDTNIANKKYVDDQFPVTHASTTGQTTDDHHAQDHAAEHETGGGDTLELNKIPVTGDVDIGAYDLTATDVNATNIKVDHIGEKTAGHDIIVDNDMDIGDEIFKFSTGSIGEIYVGRFTMRGDVGCVFDDVDNNAQAYWGMGAFYPSFHPAGYTLGRSASRWGIVYCKSIDSSGDIYTTGAGDDLWLGNATQGSANFQAYADGHLICTTINATRIASATTTITASSDTTDVSGINTLFINITSDIVLGGLTGGVNGQVLNIAILGNFTNHVRLEHAEGVSNQDFINHTGLDEDIDHGGCIYVCNGSDWYDISHAKHV